MKVTLGLQSPLAFYRPLPRGSMLDAKPEAVAIRFEGWEIVWHPPSEYRDERFDSQYGPMVAAIATDDEMDEIAYGLQRFLSAVAWAYDQPVEDEADAEFLGGEGGNDPFNPSGSRRARAHAGIFLREAPAEIEVRNDVERLGVALAYYREGLNAGSPFYRCLAFRHVLDAVFGVQHETRQKQATPEAANRDLFIDSEAPSIPSYGLVRSGEWSAYLREEVRNAIAHVLRPTRRQVDPDHWSERKRLALDARLLKELARMAVEQHWPNAVQAAPKW